ncbi:MAG: hypothetical protein ACMUHU_02970 [Thermoplasmatota archaeon]
MVGRSELDQARSAAGAIISLIAFACIGAVLITNDLYSGSAEMGTEEDMGWWYSEVDYSFMNGSVWVGENDNLVGNPDYTEYVFNYTGTDRSVIFLSIAGFSAGIILSLTTFVFGLLTSFRKVSWLLPFLTGIASFALVLAPLIALHNMVPDIVDSDIEHLGPFISESIPPEQMDNLTGNLSRGGSFFWGYLSLPFIVSGPLLMIGIRRERNPSTARLAYHFFIDDERKKEEPPSRKTDPNVKGGDL